jgi:putative nucleotidyltransferase with HDIG domain
MTAADLQYLHTWFTAYTAGFAGPAGQLSAMQQLKLDHSLRVATVARAIAVGSRWPDADTGLAEAAGLLHDVGRFSQYAEFRTFVDRNSINHAERGGDVLIQTRVLERFPQAMQDALGLAVRLHNRKALPAELPAAVRPFAQMVRDADKLDIMYLFDQAIRQDQLSLYPEIALGVDLAGPPSPAILAALRERRPADYREIRSLADFLLVQLLWVYDFGFPAALRILHERKLIRALAEHLPADRDVCALVDAAEEYLEQKIAAES